ncbi:metal regulatory transcription factor 1 [Galendromus occidentalis]|uniref:Metal regulatory transcription factor 1 n=1 Tax=Galendromus occidentalis TaxID=34638 RepID=A0AAJ6W0K8_9ACAR|nr:metal regulatory transcription factor 1 [Galendromus occidentalis]
MSSSDDRKRCTLFEESSITLQDMYHHDEICSDHLLEDLTDERTNHLVSIEHRVSDDNHLTFQVQGINIPERATHATLTIKTRDGLNGERTKGFHCDVYGCDKTYSTQGNLKTHKKRHTRELTFFCSQEGCGKAFLTSYSRNIHLRIHTHERPYKCEALECTRTFSTRYRLRAHERIHTGQTFECEWLECDRKFTTVSDRKKHSRVHTGERRFLCESCGKIFGASHHLKSHRRTHTGEKPHQCNVCSKKFATPYSFRSHVKSKHAQDILEESARIARICTCTKEACEKAECCSTCLLPVGPQAVEMTPDVNTVESPSP